MEFADGGRRPSMPRTPPIAARRSDRNCWRRRTSCLSACRRCGEPPRRTRAWRLFPRKLNGRYAMIGRQDNENLYLIYSDDSIAGRAAAPFCKPQFPWEFVQIGNCGSPIELDEGWLLLTHGVGAGAQILDRRGSARQGGSLEGAGALARAAGTAGSLRARRLCAQRGLHLRRHAASRPDRPSLRRLGHFLQFRHDQDRLVTGESAGLTPEIASIDAVPA